MDRSFSSRENSIRCNGANEARLWLPEVVSVYCVLDSSIVVWPLGHKPPIREASDVRPTSDNTEFVALVLMHLRPSAERTLHKFRNVSGNSELGLG